MKRLFLFLFVILLGFGSVGNVNAELIDRGGGLIYDDIADLTWIQDIGLAGDLKDWSGAMSWADGLAYDDDVRNVTWEDWRLPTDTELYNMSHTYKIGPIGSPFYPEYNPGPFLNIPNTNCWTSTECPNNPEDYAISYYGVLMSSFKGSSYTAMAVRQGDVALPLPGIKANASDGPVTIAPGDALSVTIALDTGVNLGDNADWWILVKLPSGAWYHYKQGSGWNSGQSFTHQGALFDVPSYQVLNTSSLTTPGLYKFYFAVDMIMNGSIDMGKIYYDSVEVAIAP